MRTVSEKESRSRFPLSMFWVVLSVLLITAGVHVAILLGMEIAGWDPIVQTHIMVLYWISVSVLLTLLIRSRMKVAYDTPLQEISEATKKVAHGDFSVRIAPLHEEGKEDYLDTMIRDLNAMITELGSIETLKTDFVSNVSHEIKTPPAVLRTSRSDRSRNSSTWAGSSRIVSSDLRISGKKRRSRSNRTSKMT